MPPPPSATPKAATPTPLPILPACIADTSALDLEVTAPEAYPEAILHYLNAAGSPISLRGLLAQAGVGAEPVSVAVADFTGDGRDDVAVALTERREDAGVRGRFVIYACSLAGYAIAYNVRTQQEYNRGYHLWAWLDMNGDDRVDLLLSQGLCGAHTCFENLRVLSWDGAAFANLLDGTTMDLPTPEIKPVDPDGDGVYAIEVSSGGFGSVGAGPQRPVTWVWSFARSDGVWRLTEKRPDPSPFRIHVLHDADDAAARADYDLAVQLYRRVIEDDELEDWIQEDGREALSAYARYRIAVIAAALQDEEAYRASLAEMEAAYPVGNARHVFVEMAILFRNAFDSGGLGAACTAVAGFAESRSETILQPLGSAVYGYANRDYNGESMCPAPVLTSP